MKSNNFRLQAMNAGALMLHMVALTAAKARQVAKQLRQEKRARNRSGWAMSGQGARECARRRQQVAYDAGLVSRRALPQA